MMTAAALERVTGALEAHGCGPVRNGSSRCPAHDDRNASLSVTPEGDRVLLHCFAGCSFDAIMGALDLCPADAFDESPADKAGVLVATYPYTDRDGVLLRKVLRYDPKAFRQQRADGTWKLKGVPHVLFMLPDVIAQVEAGGAVFITEGEEDALALRRAGMCATTNDGGANQWRDEMADDLTGVTKVFVIADKDAAGRWWAKQVVASLEHRCIDHEVLEAAKGKDARDHLRSGLTVEDFVPVDLADDVPGDTLPATVAHECEPMPEWPKMGSAGYHGLAGDMVEMIDPHTESDPVAVLTTALAMFGNAAGRGAYFVAEGRRHHPNVFVVQTGETAKGRKGSSYSQASRVFIHADHVWAKGQIRFGLSTGEGLIYAVRDPRYETKQAKEKGEAPGDYAEVMVDAGVSDKRVLVVEEEFSQVLAQTLRKANTLSATLRRAWDTGDLQNMNKNSPDKATAAHVSIVGHITKAELVRNLTSTETANGFANRFCFISVTRSKLLPDGGNLADADIERMGARFATALRWGYHAGLITRSPEAGELWHAMYPDLSEARPGLLGAVCARAEAQVMRFALIYAMLDRSPTIEVAHLEAGLAVWRYAEASARWIFGDSLGDDVADTILGALRHRPDGLSRTEINKLLGGNRLAPQIAVALNALATGGHAHVTREGGAGRPVERWHVGPC